MTTQTQSLASFLLARIAEAEAVAREAELAKIHEVIFHEATEPTRAGDESALARKRLVFRHDPARVLAECEAKRRIVEMQAANDEDRYLPGFHYKAQMIERTLRALALPYADHADFREEWRP